MAVELATSRQCSRDLKPHPPLDVLIMSEESRLGREQIETAYALKQITDVGVRVFFCLEDRERTLDSAMDKVMLSLTNFASEMERERARQGTYDAFVDKAKKRHVTGRRVFGYDNVEATDASGQRQHVVRRINDEQSAVVQRIFTLYASGMGLRRIADTLNTEGTTSPCPRPRIAPAAGRPRRCVRFSGVSCTAA